MIEIKNLTKKFGQIDALNDVSFNVKRGDVLGFLGPNGAGKSTTMNILTGYLSATSGTVKVDGHDVTAEPEEVKKLIGYLPEIPPLYTDMTVKEYLNFICDLKNVPSKMRKSMLDDIMYLLKIGDIRGRVIKNLSKGYKQRVGFAQALVGDPPILILDEPTVGLDPRQIVEMRKLITSLGKEHTIILSTHILQEVTAVCNSVVIINNGRVAASGSVSDFAMKKGDAGRFNITIGAPKAECIRLLSIIESIKTFEFLRMDRDDAVFVVESNPGTDARIDINKVFAEMNYPILELRSVGKSLEEIFIDIVNQDARVKEAFD
ncbi:MAG: ATP-binding cassette domain-containing protein [Ruminococcaceae bacterium]|nr:ATP-binding cassette domain-containing protein [Oscillospiraceae bacterium]